MKRNGVIMELLRACIDMHDEKRTRSTELCEVCNEMIAPYLIDQTEMLLAPLCVDQVEKILCYKFIIGLIADYLDEIT